MSCCCSLESGREKLGARRPERFWAAIGSTAHSEIRAIRRISSTYHGYAEGCVECSSLREPLDLQSKIRELVSDNHLQENRTDDQNSAQHCYPRCNVHAEQSEQDVQRSGQQGREK